MPALLLNFPFDHKQKSTQKKKIKLAPGSHRSIGASSWLFLHWATESCRVFLPGKYYIDLLSIFWRCTQLVFQEFVLVILGPFLLFFFFGTYCRNFDTTRNFRGGPGLVLNAARPRYHVPVSSIPILWRPLDFSKKKKSHLQDSIDPINMFSPGRPICICILIGTKCTTRSLHPFTLECFTRGAGCCGCYRRTQIPMVKYSQNILRHCRWYGVCVKCDCTFLFFCFLYSKDSPPQVNGLFKYLPRHHSRIVTAGGLSYTAGYPLS